KGEAREILTTLRARAIVHAEGALERPLLFGNNDLPGVMLAGAVRTYLNRYALVLGRRVLIATNNDSAWTTAIDLAAAGARVTIADERPMATGSLLFVEQKAAYDIRLATYLVRAHGSRTVQGAELQAADSAKTQ